MDLAKNVNGYRKGQYLQQDLSKNPYGDCPNHATGVKLPDGFVAAPLQHVEWESPPVDL